MIVIKKYGNRRLYDTSGSKYVNLEDIASLIRNGNEVQVVDARTGRDLTRVILTQIITEDAKDRPTGLPLELLRQLIVATDRARQEFMMWYLKSAFDAYRKVQDTMQNRFSEVQSAIMSPVDTMRRFLSGDSEKKPSAESEAEIKELRERIAELESRLAASTKPRTPKKPTRRKTATTVSRRS